MATNNYFSYSGTQYAYVFSFGVNSLAHSFFHFWNTSHRSLNLVLLMWLSCSWFICMMCSSATTHFRLSAIKPRPWLLQFIKPIMEFGSLSMPKTSSSTRVLTFSCFSLQCSKCSSLPTISAALRDAVRDRSVAGSRFLFDAEIRL